MVYKATGRSAYDVYNQYITDTFRRLRITVINLTGKKIIEYEKGDYIGDVIAPYGTYPADGYNEADGYYYVLKH